MPQGLQLLTFSTVALASSSTWTAMSPISQDSATFFNVPQGSEAHVGEIWAVDNLHACEIAVYGTRWHDQTYSFRGSVTSGAATAPINRSVCLNAIGVDQKIYPSDVLTVQVNGTMSDDIIVTLLVYYSDIPGIHARLARPSYVRQHAKNLLGINVNLTPGDGVLGTEVALNAADNRLHANTDYALMGFTSNLAFGAIRLHGIDTGNLAVGGPMIGMPEHDASLFYDYGVALGDFGSIPVLNSNNAGSILIGGVGTDVGACVVDAMLVELDGPFTG